MTEENFKCALCRNGYLWQGDLECVNGVLIDIDVAHEGWQRDVDYPPAPCEECSKCAGVGQTESGETCIPCNGQELLNAWSAT
jgi:hypothetical protein